jgi:hypothetical protein
MSVCLSVCRVFHHFVTTITLEHIIATKTLNRIIAIVILGTIVAFIILLDASEKVGLEVNAKK